MITKWKTPASNKSVNVIPGLLSYFLSLYPFPISKIVSFCRNMLKAYMPVMIQIFLADRRIFGSVRGSTRGPRGPKKYFPSPIIFLLFGLRYSVIIWNWNKVIAACGGNGLANLVSALVLSSILLDICVSCLFFLFCRFQSPYRTSFSITSGSPKWPKWPKSKATMFDGNMLYSIICAI